MLCYCQSRERPLTEEKQTNCIGDKVWRENIDRCGENICDLENSLIIYSETRDALSTNHVSNVKAGV